MKLEIILTPKGKETLLATVLFIKIKWGDKVAEKFVEKAYRVLDTIAQQPYLFKAYQGNDVRKGLINKHTSVIYRVLQNRIEVLFFWDNRQEPII
ncbi:MAG: type II toxin-antitoxin system RelE/ParE family toxin [Sphingobacteriales bacterium]